MDCQFVWLFVHKKSHFDATIVDSQQSKLHHSNKTMHKQTENDKGNNLPRRRREMRQWTEHEWKQWRTGTKKKQQRWSMNEGRSSKEGTWTKEEEERGRRNNKEGVEVTCTNECPNKNAGCTKQLPRIQYTTENQMKSDNYFLHLLN